MSRARHLGLGFRRIASGLAAMSALACSDPSMTIPRGEPCGAEDECGAGSLCFEGICRQICNTHQDCASKTEACEPGVCMPVADVKCEEDADCDEPSACESRAGAECYAGECHYKPRAEGSTCEDGDPCTDHDRCSSAGDCVGETLVCDDPPADVCLASGSVFRDYASIGVCYSEQGSCEYQYEDRDCPDCVHHCLGMPYAPGNVRASAGDLHVTLTWDAVDGATSYEVYVSQTAGDAASAEPVSVGGSPYVAAGLTNGTAYYFAVSAIAEAGEGDLSLEVSATPRISAPAQVVAESGTKQATLRWEPVPGADTYNAYWAEQPGVAIQSSNRVGSVTSPFVHAELHNSTRYYYALTAVDGLSESELSAEVSVSTTIDTGAKLVAPDAQRQDVFGYSVAVSGNNAIVGARYEDGGDGDPMSAAGAAYVFHLEGSSWDAGTKLMAPDAQAGDSFGYSVALSGDYAIVGAPGEAGDDDDPLPWAGAVYVFHFDGSGWDTGTKLVAPDAQESDQFGESVALSGDYAIVGASGEDGGDGDAVLSAGAAYLFHFNGSSWDTNTKLVAPDAQAQDRFGGSVAISGDYAIVGADRENGGDGDPLSSAGAAYVFHFNGLSWDAGAKLVAPDAQAGNTFGSSVALSGEYAIVGADAETGDPWTDAGAAYVFHFDGSVWDTGTKLVASDAQAFDCFGGSVAISGDYAIVGADRENGGDGDPLYWAGAAYVYRRTGPNGWDSGTKLVAPDAQEGDSFGYSVALSGDYAIVGAYKRDGGDGDLLLSAGAGYVFEH